MVGIVTALATPEFPRPTRCTACPIDFRVGPFCFCGRSGKHRSPGQRPLASIPVALRRASVCAYQTKPRYSHSVLDLFSVVNILSAGCALASEWCLGE